MDTYIFKNMIYNNMIYNNTENIKNNIHYIESKTIYITLIIYLLCLLFVNIQYEINKFKKFNRTKFIFGDNSDNDNGDDNPITSDVYYDDSGDFIYLDDNDSDHD